MSSTARPLERCKGAGVPADVMADTAALRTVMDNFPLGAMAVFDCDRRYVAAGGGGLAHIGLSRDQIEGRTVKEVFPQGPAQQITALYDQALSGMDVKGDVFYGGRIFDLRVAPLRDGTSAVVGGIVAIQDVTEAREATRRLQVAEEQFRSAFDHAPIGMALVALDGRFTQVNAALCDILGYSPDELVALTFQDITHPDDLTIDLAYAEQLAAGAIRSYRMEKRYFDARGRIVWVQLSGSAVRDAEGRIVHFIAQIEDISERKRSEEQLTRMAERDPLTGLMNRAVFDRDLASFQRAAERYGDLCGLLYLDLDGFKAVNDSAGHAAGDELLRNVAQLIRARVRISDHAYRVGGDEFAVLLPHADRDAALVLAEALRSAIAELETVGESTPRVGASIGVAEVRAGGPSPLAAADKAMYDDKRRKRR